MKIIYVLLVFEFILLNYISHASLPKKSTKVDQERSLPIDFERGYVDVENDQTTILLELNESLNQKSGNDSVEYEYQGPR